MNNNENARHKPTIYMFGKNISIPTTVYVILKKYNETPHNFVVNIVAMPKVVISHNKVKSASRRVDILSKLVRKAKRDSSEDPNKKLYLSRTHIEAKLLEPFNLFDDTSKYLKRFGKKLGMTDFFNKRKTISEVFKSDKLNDKQLAIFNYMKKNKKHVISLNAPPGTGKSFTLKTIAATCIPQMVAIVYKHDLVQSFLFLAIPKTTASYSMKVLGLGYMSLVGLQKTTSSTMTPNTYLYCCVSLLRSALTRSPPNNLYVIDECTVIHKLTLIVLIMHLKHYQRGLILCGDNNQLGSITDSAHSRQSIFTLIEPMLNQSFTLIDNERCKDPEYNKIIRYLGAYSTDDNVYPHVQALIAMRFFEKLIQPAEITDIHLGAEYKFITNHLHNKYMSMNVLRSPYYFIEDGEIITETPEYIKYKNTTNVGKFPYYLPLHVGMTYYYKSLSAHSKVVLTQIKDGYVVVRPIGSKSLINVVKAPIGQCILENHREYLVGPEYKALFNYPLYPANIMSAHMSQGCTIRDKIAIDLNHATMKSAYVMFSRIPEEEMIRRITLNSGISYILSVILNIRKVTDPDYKPTYDECMDYLKQFKLYTASLESYSLISQFCESTDKKERKRIRTELKNVCANYPTKDISPIDINDADINQNTLSVISKNYKIVTLLAHAPPQVAAVWIHEYSRVDPEFRMFFPTQGEHDMGVNTEYLGMCYAYTNGETTPQYLDRIAKLERHTDECIVYNYVDYKLVPFITAVREAYKTRNPDSEDSLKSLFTKEWLLEELEKFKMYTNTVV